MASPTQTTPDAPVHPPSIPPSTPTKGQPDDLLPLRAAARAVDRAPSTIRGWISSGELKSWKGDSTGKGNAPTLISLSELQLMVVQSGKVISPGRPSPAPEQKIDMLEIEIVELRQKLQVVEREAAEAALLRRALNLAEDGLRRGEEQVRDMRSVLEREQARVNGLEAELQVLRTSGSLPWWRRLIG